MAISIANFAFLPLIALLFLFLPIFLLYLRSFLIVFLSLIFPCSDSVCSIKASDLVSSYKVEYKGIVERIVLKSDGCYDYYRPLEGVKIENAGEWEL
jgi:hypothetical protein